MFRPSPIPHRGQLASGVHGLHLGRQRGAPGRIRTCDARFRKPHFASPKLSTRHYILTIIAWGIKILLILSISSPKSSPKDDHGLLQRSLWGSQVPELVLSPSAGSTNSAIRAAAVSAVYVSADGTPLAVAG